MTTSGCFTMQELKRVLKPFKKLLLEELFLNSQSKLPGHVISHTDPPWSQYEISMKSVWSVDPSEAEDLMRGKGKAANVFWKMDFSFLRLWKQIFCVNFIKGYIGFMSHILQRKIGWKSHKSVRLYLIKIINYLSCGFLFCCAAVNYVAA